MPNESPWFRDLVTEYERTIGKIQITEQELARLRDDAAQMHAAIAAVKRGRGELPTPAQIAAFDRKTAGESEFIEVAARVYATPPNREHTKKPRSFKTYHHWTVAEEKLLVAEADSWDHQAGSNPNWQPLADRIGCTAVAAIKRYFQIKARFNQPHKIRAGGREFYGRRNEHRRHFWKPEEIAFIVDSVNESGDSTESAPVFVTLGEFFNVSGRAVWHQYHRMQGTHNYHGANRSASA